MFYYAITLKFKLKILKIIRFTVYTHDSMTECLNHKTLDASNNANSAMLSCFIHCLIIYISCYLTDKYLKNTKSSKSVRHFGDNR